MMTIYLHLGPFSRRVIAEIDGRTAAKDSQSSRMPVAAHALIAVARRSDRGSVRCARKGKGE
jgi:hypothetical protein